MVLNGVNTSILQLILANILCIDWFIPADVNSLLIFVSKLPILDILIGTFGPLPDNNVIPVKVPNLIDISLLS